MYYIHNIYIYLFLKNIFKEHFLKGGCLHHICYIK